MAQGDWLAQRSTLFFFGVPVGIAIQNGRLSFNGGPTFEVNAQGAIAKWRANMNLGGMRVTTRVRVPTNSPAYMLIAASPDWSSYVAVGIRNVSVDIATGAGFPFLTSRKSALATVVDGDWMSVEWLSGPNRYDVYQHTDPNDRGTTPILSWIDEDDIVTHGGGYQYAGAMLTCAGWTNSAALDDFGLRDVAAPVPNAAGTDGLPLALPFPLPGSAPVPGPAGPNRNYNRAAMIRASVH